MATSSNGELFVLKCGLLNDSDQVERYDYITWSSNCGTLLSTEIINFYGVQPEYSVWHAFKSFELLVKDEKDDVVVIEQEKNVLPVLKLMKQAQDKPLTIWVRCPYLKQKPRRLSNPPKMSTSSRLTSGQQHENWDVACSNCRGVIRGFIYQCLECPAYNLCSECDYAGAHADHPLIRLAGPLPKNMDAVRQIIKEAIQQEEDESPLAIRHEFQNILHKIEAGIDRINSDIQRLESASNGSALLEGTLRKLENNIQKQLDRAVTLISARVAELSAQEREKRESPGKEGAAKSKENHVEMEHTLPLEEVQDMLEAELEPKAANCSSLIFPSKNQEESVSRDEDAYWTLVEKEASEAEASEVSLKKLLSCTLGDARRSQ